MMPDKPWKVAERRVASLFGTKRRPLSGGNHGTGQRDDGQHPRLFLEAKHSKSHALWRLWLKCRDHAAKEMRRVKRRPVIALFQKNHPGALLVVHQDDVLSIALEVFEAMTNDPDYKFFSLYDTERFLREFRSMVNYAQSR